MLIGFQAPKHMERVGLVHIDTVFEMMKEANRKNYQHGNVNVAGKAASIMSKRLKVFKKNGVNCNVCGAKGYIFAVERHKKHIGDGYHLNLYTKDGRLMTNDHIIPKSQGGSNGMENLQPMCQNCNNKKGSELKHNYCPIKLREST